MESSPSSSSFLPAPKISAASAVPRSSSGSIAIDPNIDPKVPVDSIMAAREDVMPLSPSGPCIRPWTFFELQRSLLFRLESRFSCLPVVGFLDGGLPLEGDDSSRIPLSDDPDRDLFVPRPPSSDDSLLRMPRDMLLVILKALILLRILILLVPAPAMGSMVPMVSVEALISPPDPVVLILVNESINSLICMLCACPLTRLSRRHTSPNCMLSCFPIAFMPLIELSLRPPTIFPRRLPPENPIPRSALR